MPIGTVLLVILVAAFLLVQSDPHGTVEPDGMVHQSPVMLEKSIAILASCFTA